MTSPKLTGPWSRPEITAFLESAIIPVRLAVVSEAGWPVIVSLWFLYEDGLLFCATRSTSKVAKLLANQSRVGFEVAVEKPPYYGIRGQGLASVSRDIDAKLLTRLANRYLGEQETRFRRWLINGADEEAAIKIRPVRIMSWDYRRRMAS